MYKIILMIIFFGIIFSLISCSNPYKIEIPSWYLEPPYNKSFTTTSGFGQSKHKQLALDMAIMAAKRSAADKISSDVKGRSKYHLSEGTSQGSEIAMIEDIKMTIENYRQLKAEIIETTSGYEAYVLLSFPPQFNNEIFTEIERN
tara:strand:+ start:3278 stop:3712 length:435 start_codon:yes stop_codon:yes gene_type:complete